MSQGMGRRSFIAGAAAAWATSSIAQSAATPSPNERLGVGIIGCGNRAQSHVQALIELENADRTVEIVALCDIYKPRLDRMAEKLARPLDLYRSYRELLENPKVDMVCIATPDHHHARQAIDALNKGKHVYCEKPLTHWRQFPLAKELAKTAQTSGAAFQLGAQRMSDSAFRQMKQLVRDGIIGQPIHAECGIFRTGDWGERGMPIDDENAKPGPDLDWEAFLGDAPRRDFDVSRFFRWRMYEDYAGGPATDLYPHVLTQVVDMLGLGMPECAVATGGKFRYDEREVPDTFNLLLDYPERITIALLGSQGSSYQGTGNRDDLRIPILRGWEGALTIEGEEIMFVADDEARKKGRKDQRFPIEHGHNMLFLMRNWVDCARSGRRELDSGPDLAYRTHVALLMGMTAWRERKTACFDTATETIVA